MTIKELYEWALDRNVEDAEFTALKLTRINVPGLGTVNKKD